MGAEAFDAEGKISLRKLVRSKIFLVFSITYVQAAIALPLTYYVLAYTRVVGSVQIVVYIISILIGIHLSTLIGLYWFMSGSIKIPLVWKSIAKYVLASVSMGIVLFLLPNTSTLFLTIGKAVMGFAIYIGLLLAIDGQARELIRLIWIEIRGTLRQLTFRSQFR
jgi:hypothetical protein